MKLNIKEICIFGMLGTLIYVLKVAMQFLPNIHLVGVFTVAATVVYRKKALWPLYVYVLIEGLFSGFAAWWVPYLYIWAVLWAMVMLLPKKIPARVCPLVYMGVCALHGFLFGTLYAPFQAVAFGLSFNGMLAWIIAGLPWDFVHGVSNFFCGLLIVPIVHVLSRADAYICKD